MEGDVAALVAREVKKASVRIKKKIIAQDKKIDALGVTITEQSATIARQSATIAEQGEMIAAQRLHIASAATATSLLVVGEIAGELRLQCFRKKYGPRLACPSTYRPTDTELAFFHICKPAYLKLFHERVWAAHPSIADLQVLEHIAQYLLAVFPEWNDFSRYSSLLQSLQFARALYGPIPANDRMKITPAMVHFPPDHMPQNVVAAVARALTLATEMANEEAAK